MNVCVATPTAAPARDHVRLLFVGRIGDRRKGARYLFDAFRELMLAYPTRSAGAGTGVR